MPAGPVTWTLEAVGSVVAQLLAQVLDLVDVVGRGGRRHRDRGEGGRTVLRHHDRSGLPATGLAALLRRATLAGLGAARLREQLDRLGVEVLLGGLVDLAGAGRPEHDRDLAVVLGQLLGELDGEGAVGARGQGVDGAVVALALGHQRDDGEREEDGHQGHQPRRTASGRRSGQERGAGDRAREFLGCSG